MSELSRYIDLIVEPTFTDFQANPLSVRHCFLACVATYHAIDRVSYPKSVGNLRKAWRDECFEFLIVDMVAHRFKHVRSNDELHSPNASGIPLSYAVFGKAAFNTKAFNEVGIDVRNLYFVVRDTIKFLRQKADSLPEIPSE